MYNYGTRRGHILFAALRAECSSLDAHLYSKLSSTTLNAPVESSRDTLCFTCVQLIGNKCFNIELDRLAFKVLLFEVEEVADEENKALFLKVQDFIIKPKHFI